MDIQSWNNVSLFSKRVQQRLGQTYEKKTKLSHNQSGQYVNLTTQHTSSNQTP